MSEAAASYNRGYLCGYEDGQVGEGQATDQQQYRDQGPEAGESWGVGYEDGFGDARRGIEPYVEWPDVGVTLDSDDAER